ncbi:IS66 family insertion sequence element accessory protein TnpB [Escherichia coli]|uniref:IS66 family insertion sequence element accessory protein TnpB n=1 Tax=Escherichia coli TaxID=562 RepID=UPI003D81A315
MISLPAGSRIWLVAGITDMRNGFNGLASKVQNVLKDDPFSGHLFIFRGRRGDQIKVLWADSDGLCLFTKRLERGRFVWPVTRDGKVLNRPGFPGECFICELRLPDHRFRWKHNKLFLLLPVEYGPAFPAIVDCYTSPPT